MAEIWLVVLSVCLSVPPKWIHRRRSEVYVPMYSRLSHSKVRAVRLVGLVCGVLANGVMPRMCEATAMHMLRQRQDQALKGSSLVVERPASHSDICNVPLCLLGHCLNRIPLRFAFAAVGLAKCLCGRKLFAHTPTGTRTATCFRTTFCCCARVLAQRRRPVVSAGIDELARGMRRVACDLARM